MTQDAPTVVILAGPNGAGKTTSARTVLAETLSLMTFVNADTIAQGLSAFSPESSAIEAGRIMLRRLHELAKERADFAFESTLAGRSYVRWLKSLRGEGYTVHLVYFWLASADLAVARVAERVRTGGHDIRQETIRQRYGRSLENFFRIYCPIASSWKIYNNSEASPQLIVKADVKGQVIVLNEAVWNNIRKGHVHE